MQWYECPPGTPTLPFPSPISSLDWQEEPFLPSTIGEVYGAPRIFVPQSEYPCVVKKWCGNVQWEGHAQPAPPPGQTYWNNWPVCCGCIPPPPPSGLTFTGDLVPTVDGPCFSTCESVAKALYEAGSPLFLCLTNNDFLPPVLQNVLWTLPVNPLVEWGWRSVLTYVDLNYNFDMELSVALDPISGCWVSQWVVQSQVLGGPPIQNYTQQINTSQATDSSTTVTCLQGLNVTIDTSQNTSYTATGSGPYFLTLPISSLQPVCPPGPPPPPVPDCPTDFELFLELEGPCDSGIVNLFLQSSSPGGSVYEFNSTLGLGTAVSGTWLCNNTNNTLLNLTATKGSSTVAASNVIMTGSNDPIDWYAAFNCTGVGTCAGTWIAVIS